jgi:DNA gyrase inhibitor GyrI
VIDNATRCEICAVIQFHHAKNMSYVEIHCGVCLVFGKNIMSEATVQQWCRMFKGGRTNVLDEE